MSQESEIEARDEVAPSWEQWVIESEGFWSDWIEKRVTMNYVDPREHETILDAGCGTGRITRLIARKCKKVYALDFSSRGIDVLNERAHEEGINNIESRVWDLTLPFSLEEPVDKVVSIGVVECIPTERGQHRALQNMYDQLHDGGTLVIGLCNWRAFFVRRVSKEGRYPDGVYYRRFTADEAITALQECGFKSIFVGGYENVLHRALGLYRFPSHRRLSGIPYLIAQTDLFLSKFNASRLFGYYLICRASR